MHSSHIYSEVIERYKKNNVDLATSLNERRTDLRLANEQLIFKSRELQLKCDEIAHLKQELEQKEKQMSTWRTAMIQVFQSNTQSYATLMTLIGCNLMGPSTNNVRMATAAEATSTSTSTNNVQVETISNSPLGTEETNRIQQNIDRFNKDTRLQRVQTRRMSMQSPVSPNRLENLIEEPTINIESLNESSSSSSSSAAEVSPRRRASNTFNRSPLKSSANDSPAKNTRRMSTQETEIQKLVEPPNKKKPSSYPKQNMQNIKIDDTKEYQTNRPRRKAAPGKLVEPKVNTKLRRKC